MAELQRFQQEALAAYALGTITGPTSTGRRRIEYITFIIAFAAGAPTNQFRPTSAAKFAERNDTVGVRFTYDPSRSSGAFETAGSDTCGHHADGRQQFGQYRPYAQCQRSQYWVCHQRHDGWSGERADRDGYDRQQLGRDGRNIYHDGGQQCVVGKCQPDECPSAERRQLHGDGGRLKRARHCNGAGLAERDS